jgi:Fe2+ or Zn2+ uptake regulation protein
MPRKEIISTPTDLTIIDVLKNNNKKPLSITEIAQQIKEKFNIPISKPTIYKAMDFLKNNNQNIHSEVSRANNNRKGVFCEKFFYKKQILLTC